MLSAKKETVLGKGKEKKGCHTEKGESKRLRSAHNGKNSKSRLEPLAVRSVIVRFTFRAVETADVSMLMSQPVSKNPQKRQQVRDVTPLVAARSPPVSKG